MSYIPDRGDVVWLTFDPKRGHEQAGRRPALILSSSIYNGRAQLALCCPITSQVKGYPFEVQIPEGTILNGVILADQVQSVDWKARGADFITKVDKTTLEEVTQKVLILVYQESN